MASKTVWRILILKASDRKTHGRDLKLFLLTKVRTKEVEDKPWLSMEPHVHSVYRTTSELGEGGLIVTHFTEMLVLSASFKPDWLRTVQNFRTLEACIQELSDLGNPEWQSLIRQPKTELASTLKA